MNQKYRLRLQALVAVLCALTAASVLAGVPDRTVHILTSNNELAQSSESQPTAIGAPLPITGVNAGDTLQAIDVRPSNGRLYALGANAGAGTVQLYHISSSISSALATPIGTPGTFVDAIGMPVLITSAGFGVDFNPAVDRVRVVTSDGRNFRMNPNTGAFVDGDLGGSPGSVAGLNMDGALNGAANTAHACAYTNSRINTTATTLYTIDAASDQLMIQNPPNMGTLTAAQIVMQNGSPLDLNVDTGFDIPPGVDVASSNAPANGTGYLVSLVGGNSNFYRLNLANATATLVGAFSGITARDIAVSVNPTALVSSVASVQLARFPLGQPQSAVMVSLTGGVAGETIVGMDGRPATGGVYALGINAATNTGTVYVVDPQTGTLSIVGGVPGIITFVDGVGTPIDFADTAYGVDFNPAVDRLRVVSLTNGLNFRVNPITGGPVDGDAASPGVNPDGSINGAGVTGLGGAGYTNNFAGTTITTLYTLDPAGNQLLIQNPPNAGTQTPSQVLTFGGVAFDFLSSAGFDIPPGVNAPANSMPAAGTAYATLASAAQTGLFRVDLASGQLQFIGAPPINADGLIVWQTEIDPIFFDGFE